MRQTHASLAAFPALVAAVALASAGDATRLAYRFEEVKSKVVVTEASAPEKERKAAAGDVAWSGDRVRTGFWGRAVVSVPDRKARFEISSSTTAVLAGGEPGVLLTIEKGRLKAIFDALTEGAPQERRVAAPGALLSVRGTRYGVEVVDGETLLAVFEGVVEVTPTAPGFKALQVRADELCTFGPKAPPRPGPMRERGIDEKSWENRPRGGSPDGRGEMPGARGAPGARPGEVPGGTSKPGAPGGSAPPGGSPMGSPQPGPPHEP